MHKLLVLVVLVVLVLASALAWLLLSPERSRDPAARSATVREPAPEATRAAPPAPGIETGLTAVADDPETGETERKRADSQDFDPALALEVHGSVGLPDDMPGDERVRVLVAEPGAHARLDALRAPDEPEAILAEAEVDGLGRFRIGIPRDRGVVLV